MNRPQRTNNPGNLRYVGQRHSTGQDEHGMAVFPHAWVGWVALHNQIKLDQSRGMTLKQFINKYAPSNENDTSAYLRFVAKEMRCEADTPLEDLSRYALAGVIAKMEGYFNED